MDDLPPHEPYHPPSWSNKPIIFPVDSATNISESPPVPVAGGVSLFKIPTWAVVLVLILVVLCIPISDAQLEALGNLVLDLWQPIPHFHGELLALRDEVARDYLTAGDDGSVPLPVGIYRAACRFLSGVRGAVFDPGPELEEAEESDGRAYHDDGDDGDDVLLIMSTAGDLSCYVRIYAAGAMLAAGCWVAYYCAGVLAERWAAAPSVDNCWDCIPIHGRSEPGPRYR